MYKVTIGFKVGDKFDEKIMGGVFNTTIDEITVSVNRELELSTTHRIWYVDSIGNHSSGDESYLDLPKNQNTIEFEPKLKIGEKGLVYNNYVAGAKFEYEKVIGYGLQIKQARFGEIEVIISYHTEHSMVSANQIYKNPQEYLDYLSRDLSK